MSAYILARLLCEQTKLLTTGQTPSIIVFLIFFRGAVPFLVKVKSWSILRRHSICRTHSFASKGCCVFRVIYQDFRSSLVPRLFHDVLCDDSIIILLPLWWWGCPLYRRRVPPADVRRWLLIIISICLISIVFTNYMRPSGGFISLTGTNSIFCQKESCLFIA